MDKAKILLVDDRPENLLALEAILSSLDQVLVRAGSGEEALKALLTDEFAVVLLDVQMPGMDGFETAEHIKRRDKTRDLPIIFLTAIDKEPQHAFRGYAAGAVDYLAKPFDPWVLRAKVQVFVDLDRKNRQLRRQAELLRGQLPSARGPGGTAVGTAGGSSGGSSGGTDSAVVCELSARLAAVEEQTERLVEQGRVTVDAALVDAIAGLAERVRRLREALETFDGAAT